MSGVWEFESVTGGKQPQRTPRCSELAVAELCLLLLGTAKPERQSLLSASAGKELVACSTPPHVLSSEETGHSDGKQPKAGANLQREQAGMVALDWPRFPRGGLGASLRSRTLRTARCAASPGGSPLPSSWRAWDCDGGAGRGRVRADRCCTSARCLLRLQSQSGGGQRQPVPKKLGSRFLPH